MKMTQLITIAALTIAATTSFNAIADVSIYGSIRVGVIGVDDDGGMDWEVSNHFSRFGLKGSEDIGNGIKALGRFEFAVEGDTGSISTGSTERLSYVGLESDLGGLYLGAQWSPFYDLVGGFTDQFNSVGGDHIHSTFRLADSVKYYGSFGDATVSAMAVMDDFSRKQEVDAQNNITKAAFDDDDAIDILQLALKFDAGAVDLGIAIDKRAESQGDGSRFGIGAIYRSAPILASAVFTKTDASIEPEIADFDPNKGETASDAKDIMAIDIYTGYSINNGQTIGISYGQTDNGSSSTPFTLSLGYQQKISKRTKFWIEGSFTDSDSASADITQIGVGLRHDW